MAAKKPTTKLKTKTTKATKVTKKSVAVTTAKPSKVASKKFLNKFSFKQLHVLSIVSFILLAVVAFVLMNSSTYELTVTYLTKDALANGTLVPAYRHLLDVPYRTFIVVFLLLAASFPFLLETKYKHTYKKVLAAKTIAWGWVEKGILQSVLAILVAYLLGFQDIATIKLIALVVISANLFGWIAERQHNAGNKAAHKTALVGLSLIVLVLLMIGGALLFTHVYGLVRASWFHYATFGALVFGLLTTRLKQLKYLSGRSGSDYEHVAKTYLLIGYVTYVAMAVILIVGLAK